VKPPAPCSIWRLVITICFFFIGMAFPLNTRTVANADRLKKRILD
jgi:hypothetical protein